MAVGDGRVGDLTYEMMLKPGDTVVYSKFGIGTTDLDVSGHMHTLLREDDCIGIMPKSGATAADIPQLRPVGDRVLIKASQPRVCHHLAAKATLRRRHQHVDRQLCVNR